MIPILYEANEKSFNHNGLGALVDAGYCTVTEERNGAYELELQYPVIGNRYSEIALDRIIFAKPNDFSNPQAFRIYHISKPMNGIVTVRAEHVSYQLSSILVNSMSANNPQELFEKIENLSIGENPFDFYTNVETSGRLATAIPRSVRSLLGGSEKSAINTYGGELEFDNYTVKLHNQRGKDNGVLIAYSKNLTGLKCDERMDGVVNGVLPYWVGANEFGTNVIVRGNLQSVENNFSYSRYVVLDCSSEFEAQPTVEQVNNFAQSQLAKAQKVPFMSISVEFVNLGDTEEYKQFKRLQSVKLCDTITVKYPLYGINVKSKVVKTVYDSIRERYEKIEVGTLRKNISQTISNQSQEIAQKSDKPKLETE